MCEFFSAIYTKDGRLLYNFSVDSHEDLITLFDLCDDESNYLRQKWVRIEFVPDLTKDLTNPSNWRLELDETNPPDWWDAEKVAKKCWDAVSKIIITGHHKILVDGVCILAGEAKIDKVIGTTYIKYMWGSSQVGKMCGSSQVGKMCGSSQVGEMWGSSQVGEMCDSSQVGKMWGSSQVGKMWGSSQIIKDYRKK